MSEIPTLHNLLEQILKELTHIKKAQQNFDARLQTIIQPSGSKKKAAPETIEVLLHAMHEHLKNYYAHNHIPLALAHLRRPFGVRIEKQGLSIGELINNYPETFSTYLNPHGGTMVMATEDWKTLPLSMQATWRNCTNKELEERRASNIKQAEWIEDEVRKAQAEQATNSLPSAPLFGISPLEGSSEKHD